MVRGATVRAALRRRPLAAFFGLAFGISWGVPGLLLGLQALTGAFAVDLGEFTPLGYLVVWSPALSAGIVLAAHGRKSLRGLARRLARWRVHPGWWLAIALGVPLANLLAALGMEALGESWYRTPQASAAGFLGVAAAKATLGPVEEVGWRGLALPLLQRRLGGLAAAVVLGLVWGLWHVPAFFVASVMQGSMVGDVAWVQLQHFAGITATSVILAVIWNGTRGALPPCMLFHWLSNLPYPWEARGGISPVQTALLVVAAVVLAATIGRRVLAPSALVTDPAPER